jgi:hypothetical protein
LEEDHRFHRDVERIHAREQRQRRVVKRSCGTCLEANS